MRIPLASTIRARKSTTDKGARLLNAYAEIRGDPKKGGISRVTKRPALGSAYEVTEGLGQILFTVETPDDTDDTLVAVTDDLLDTVPTRTPRSAAYTVQPSESGPGVAISPSIVVRIVDVFGNTLTSFTGNVTIGMAANPAGGTLSGTLTVAASSGVATFSNVKVSALGESYRLKASASGVKAKVSDAFDIAAYLEFLRQPSTAEVDTAIAPAIKVRLVDINDTVLTAFSGDVTVALEDNPTDAILTGTLTQALSSGVATFSNLQVDEFGQNYTLSATLDDEDEVDEVESNPFNIGFIGIAPYISSDLTQSRSLEFETADGAAMVPTSLTPMWKGLSGDDATAIVISKDGLSWWGILPTENPTTEKTMRYVYNEALLGSKEIPSGATDWSQGMHPSGLGGWVAWGPDQFLTISGTVGRLVTDCALSTFQVEDDLTVTETNYTFAALEASLALSGGISTWVTNYTDTTGQFGSTPGATYVSTSRYFFDTEKGIAYAAWDYVLSQDAADRATIRFRSVVIAISSKIINQGDGPLPAEYYVIFDGTKDAKYQNTGSEFVPYDDGGGFDEAYVDGIQQAWMSPRNSPIVIETYRVGDFNKARLWVDGDAVYAATDDGVNASITMLSNVVHLSSGGIKFAFVTVDSGGTILRCYNNGAISEVTSDEITTALLTHDGLYLVMFDATPQVRVWVLATQSVGVTRAAVTVASLSNSMRFPLDFDTPTFYGLESSVFKAYTIEDGGGSLTIRNVVLSPASILVDGVTFEQSIGTRTQLLYSAIPAYGWTL